MSDDSGGIGDSLARLPQRIASLLELLTTLDHRLETAILNIEKATVHLDQTFQGGLEMLPDFVSKRLKAEGRKSGPSPTTE